MLFCDVDSGWGFIPNQMSSHHFFFLHLFMFVHIFEMFSMLRQVFQVFHDCLNVVFPCFHVFACVFMFCMFSCFSFVFMFVLKCFPCCFILFTFFIVFIFCHVFVFHVLCCMFLRANFLRFMFCVSGFFALCFIAFFFSLSSLLQPPLFVQSTLFNHALFFHLSSSFF